LGFSKVIERHANRQAVPAGEEELKHIPTPTRTPFGSLTPADFAASDKAFDFTDGKTWENSLIDALEHLGTGHLARTAPDWTIWRSRIQEAPGPKLLVLLPHSDTILSNVEVLEIGVGDQLSKAEILEDLVGALDKPQLLLLLGCGTAQVGKEFAPYPELFHDAGADIIIAPLAPILGADAAPIAQQIAKLLAERTAKGGELTFGELLRQVRCDLLAQGHPGVLGLVNFGDADWMEVRICSRLLPAGPGDCLWRIRRAWENPYRLIDGVNAAFGPRKRGRESRGQRKLHIDLLVVTHIDAIISKASWAAH
jgi:hypothetical protein